MFILIQLSISFFQIGLFSIGGGYATISLIQKIIVTEKNWINIKEFTDIITISQMTPGPLAVNSSTFVGLQIAGLPGAIIATVSTVISGCFISIFLNYFFEINKNSILIKKIFSGLEGVAIGLIASASLAILSIALWGNMTFDVSQSKVNIIALLMLLVSLTFLRKWKLNPMIILIITGILGLIVYN